MAEESGNDLGQVRVVSPYWTGSWEDLTGRKAEHLEYYEVLGAYKFSLMMYRIVGIHKKTGVFPADSDYDIHNLASNTIEKVLPDA